MHLMFRMVLILALLVATLIGGVYLYAERSYHQPGPLAEEKIVLIPPGTGFKRIAHLLAEEGVLAQPQLFMGIVFLEGQQRAFKAGEYRFAAHIAPERVAEMLVKGEVVAHSITVPEGLTSAEILAILAHEEALSGDLPKDVPEGSLLPETYQFVRGDAREGVLARMQKAMEQALAKAWAHRTPGLPLASPQEAVILASIVEKETGVADERGRVAAVFLNRLKQGMKLQSDPTTLYGIIKATGARPERLLTRDLEAATPYNTYVITGLPPTPIAHPGAASLAAVLNPPQTEELYFVASGNGGHRFARTLGEHNRNVQRYRAFLKTLPARP